MKTQNTSTDYKMLVLANLSPAEEKAIRVKYPHLDFDGDIVPLSELEELRAVDRLED